MAQPVWVLSVDLQTKTATFQSGMADAARSARGAFNEIKSGAGSMGESVGGSAGSARQALILLGDEFGVHLPRGLTTFLASLGPFGAAMEAAFPFVAIALGATLLLQRLAELKAAGEKLTDDQIRFETTAQNVFNSLDEKILQTQIRTDELRNDHLGALRHELELINRQSMSELASQFGILAKDADVVFDELKSHWYSFSSGSAGAKRSMESFTLQYEALLAKGDKEGASNLLSAKLERETKILALLNQADSNKGKAGTDSDEAWAAELRYREAINGLKRMDVTYDDAALKSAQQIVKTLHEQQGTQARVAKNQTGEGDNAKLTYDKERAAKTAEADRQAAEHAQKMGELSIAIERTQGEAALSMKQATVAEKLALDLRLADEEYNVQLTANSRLTDALNKGADDYNNQLKAMHEKAEEITRQHEATVTELTSRAATQQYHEDVQALEQSERQKIDATLEGTQQRLAALDAALKEEATKNLQGTSNYRELLNQRTEAERRYNEESAKLTAEAGKQAAENTQKMGELGLEAERQQQALRDSARHTSAQQQADEDLYFANESYDIKMQAMLREEAALNKSGEDYLNKLKAMQDQERQLVQEHENQITQIKNQAEEERNQRILAAETHFYDSISAGLTQVLMGHKSFASMMNSIGNEVVSGLADNAIKSILANNMTKESDAAAAARKAFVTGESIPIIGPFMGPALAATAYAGVMAFQEGTDYVPGYGKGDKVPAMLEPGEGVVPGGVMDKLRGMANKGDMGGDKHYHAHVQPTYHLQALDSSGMSKILEEHSDTLTQHVTRTLRKMNR